MVVHPLGLHQHPLLPEAEPLGYRAAPAVLHGAAHLDAVQLQLAESVFDERAARPCDQPAPLERGAEPVADLRRAVDPVNVVVLNLPGHLAAVPDGKGVPAVLRHPGHVALDEVARVLDGAFALEPRRPLAYVFEVALDQRVQGLRVSRLDEAQLGLVVYFVAEHGGRSGRRLSRQMFRVPAGASGSAELWRESRGTLRHSRVGASLRRRESASLSRACPPP